MTTKVTVDAHAGWDVKVTPVVANPNVEETSVVVKAGTIQDFYVWDGRILRIEEIEKVEVHASDCAVHNEPALPAGPCDCK